MIKKGLAIAVILLFIGVAVAPTINANVSKASEDSEMVEITTEVCGIDGAKPETKKMTKEEAIELDRLFNEIKKKLDNVEKREEVAKIFNQAVIELNDCGLLPDGMTVEEAQKLVTMRYKSIDILRFFEDDYDIYQEKSEEINNFLCLIAGRTNRMDIFPLATPFFLFLYNTFWVLGPLAFILGLDRLYNILINLFFFTERFFDWYHLFVNKIQPIVFGADVWFIRSEGWVLTMGLSGIKKINGSFLGKVPFYIKGLRYAMWGEPGRGALGFTGLKWSLDWDNWSGLTAYYLGSALQVRLGPED